MRLLPDYWLCRVYAPWLRLDHWLSRVHQWFIGLLPNDWLRRVYAPWLRLDHWLSRVYQWFMGLSNYWLCWIWGSALDNRLTWPVIVQRLIRSADNWLSSIGHRLLIRSLNYWFRGINCITYWLLLWRLNNLTIKFLIEVVHLKRSEHWVLSWYDTFRHVDSGYTFWIPSDFCRCSIIHDGTCSWSLRSLEEHVFHVNIVVFLILVVLRVVLE